MGGDGGFVWFVDSVQTTLNKQTCILIDRIHSYIHEQLEFKLFLSSITCTYTK